MGRALLILALLLGACGGSEQPPPRTAAERAAAAAQPAADPGAGHRGMACGACHAGARADSGRASVPRASCTAAGCHEDGGPEQVRTGLISFPHRDHGQTGPVVASCAGCHDHHDGDQALHVEVGACALCHVSAVSGEKTAECKLCHDRPEHIALSSQSLPIPHGALPWVETGCVRCHYDVAEPLVRVSTAKCAACHADLAAVTAAGIGDDLHPAHAGLGCLSCHQEGAHRVRAMSSAVALDCADCHTAAHGLRLPSRFEASPTCSACHTVVHQAQQRLLLGIIDERTPAAPSNKFMAGVTCRSCHVRDAASEAAAGPIRGSAESCVGCHRNEYRRVLDWWVRGTAARVTDLRAWAGRGAADLGAAAPDTSQRLMERARDLIQLVDDAGGYHNLELSDRLLREARLRVFDAYRLAGRTAPPAPDLGTSAHEGLCTFCHYAPGDVWNLRRMPADFHEEVMRPQGGN